LKLLKERRCSVMLFSMRTSGSIYSSQHGQGSLQGKVINEPNEQLKRNHSAEPCGSIVETIRLSQVVLLLKPICWAKWFYCWNHSAEPCGSIVETILLSRVVLLLNCSNETPTVFVEVNTPILWGEVQMLCLPNRKLS
jgi:hypothetical protein